VKNPIRLAAALPITLALVLGACGSSGSKTDNAAPAAAADGDKGAFCATNAEINAGTKGATSADEFVTLLAPFESSLVTFAANAPAVVKVDAQMLVVTSQKALSTKDGSGFADPQVAAAGKNIDTFCGTPSN
jgi:hypothetical protein